MNGNLDLKDWNNKMYKKYGKGWKRGLVGCIQRRRLNAVKKIADVRPYERVIDIGCEAGHLISILPECREIIGIDISAEALKDAKLRCKDKAEFRLLDAAEPLLFEEESFDVVFAGEILEHVKNPASVLMNIHRIIKKDGRIIITIPNEVFYIKIKALFKKIKIFNFLFTGISLEKGEWHLHHDFNKQKTIRLIEPYFVIRKIKSIFHLHYIFLLKKGVWLKK